MERTSACHLLDPAFLERSEFRRSGLHVELSSTPVLFTHFTDARVERGDLPPFDVLEDFGSARIASVRVDLEEGFDFGDSGDDTSDCDEFSEVSSSYLSHGESRFGTEGTEVEVAEEERSNE